MFSLNLRNEIRVRLHPLFVPGLFMIALISEGCRSPASTTMESRPAYTIRSYESDSRADSTAKTVDRVLKHYSTLFGVPLDRVEPLNLIMGSRKTAYGVDEFPALYQISTSSIHFKREPDTMLLLHEIAHHFVKMRLGRKVPLWLNEGIATYLGWSAMDEDHLVIGEIPVIHFKILKEMSRDQTLIPLDEFFSMSAAEFYDPAFSRQHYSQAWGFVFYMLHGNLIGNRSFREKLDLLAEIPESRLVANEEMFVRFCRDFSAAQMMCERLDTDLMIRRLSCAFRLGLLQDESSLDTLMEVARDRNHEDKLRMVALYAGALIALRNMPSIEEEELKRFLLCLKHREHARISVEAGILHARIEQEKLKSIFQDFVSLNTDHSFYPTSRFSMSAQG